MISSTRSTPQGGVGETKFGDPRSNGFRDIQGADIVSNRTKPILLAQNAWKWATKKRYLSAFVLDVAEKKNSKVVEITRPIKMRGNAILICFLPSPILHLYEMTSWGSFIA